MEIKNTQSEKIWDTLYLNNLGSRWIVVERNFGHKLKKIKVRVSHLGEVYERTALYFESFGNFSSVTVSIGGKKINFCDYEILL